VSAVNRVLKSLVAVVGVLLVTLVVPSTARGAERYRVVPLGTLGGDGSQPYAVNDRGEVVGSSSTGTATHPFVWRNGTMTDLGVLEAGPYEYGRATDINERGQVVGFSVVNGDPEESGSHAFLWDQGVLKDLGTLGGEDSLAFGINDRGEVVGFSQIATGELHAFRWSRGRMSDLGPGEAHGINDASQVAGWAVLADGNHHAARWQRGAVTYLDGLSLESSGAQAINRAGWAVGSGTSTYTEYHPYLWRAGRMIDLGSLGGSSGSAMSINDRGQIVGTSAVTGDATGHPYLWQGGRMTDLVPRGVPATFEPADVNNRGWIVGVTDYTQGIVVRT
jgi:probable HAF family extracellular repeat protein